MDRCKDPYAAVEVAGLCVKLERNFQVAALRYFDVKGGFGAAVQDLVGGSLPEPLRAVELAHAANRSSFILAWRSPTECMLLSEDPAAFAGVQKQLAIRSDGCFVDQTDGIWALKVGGNRGADLLLRLGATASVPEQGAARTTRVAELAVLGLCVRAGEIVLLVERVYADHLFGWIAETLADF